jgi:alcohol dehydrogenase (cytochrome c)
MAGDRIQPQDRNALYSVDPVLRAYDAESARSRGEIYGRRPRRLSARSSPEQRRQLRSTDAVRLADRAQVWSHESRAASSSAALPTAGGLVFAGSVDRWFRAFDDQTGKLLWQTRLNNVVNAFPISFSVGGKQYVAIAAGNGSSEVKSLNALTPEIRNPDGGSVLWVFALP